MSAHKWICDYLSLAGSANIGKLWQCPSHSDSYPSMSVEEGDDRFEFTQIIANMTLANGIANNTNFNLSAPLSEIRGSGQVDLVKQAIDYALKLNLSKNKGNNENFIPVKISGPLTKPSYAIDTASLLQAKAGQEVKTKIQDKINEELGDKVGKDILKALPF